MIIITNRDWEVGVIIAINSEAPVANRNEMFEVKTKQQISKKKWVYGLKCVQSSK